MARSSIGGASSMIRGAVGDYVYQIRKDLGSGATQVVLSYNRERKNPNTKYQCLARMQIALMERAMTVMLPVIQDSFQGVAAGVTSVNTFVSLNMKDIQKFCKEHWDSGALYQFPEKGVEENSFGPFIIGYGSYTLPKVLTWTYRSQLYGYTTYHFKIPGSTSRLYDLRKQFQFSYTDTLNLLCIADQGWLGSAGLMIVQLQFNKSFGDYTQITAASCSRVFNTRFLVNGFTFNGEVFPRLSWSFDASTNTLSVEVVPVLKNPYGEFDLYSQMHAVLASKKSGNRWLRNNSFLQPCHDWDWDSGDYRSPQEAYTTWDSKYNDESYQDYFGK